MRRDKVGESIAHKVFMCAMSIERAGSCEPVDHETAMELRRDAQTLARDPEFRKAYASRNGAGAIWLDGLMKDARAPYRHDETIVERELWKWMREANERA
jgi:hypothetical protein